jgi:phosphohistidine phosphatase
MQLWIVRHAKARQPLADEWDRDRPLTETGREDARRLNTWLQDCGRPLPDRVLVSPAVRTRQTAERVLNGLAMRPPVFDERLWEADDEDLVEILSEQAEEVDRLMLIAHNPGLEWLVRWLTGQRLTLGLQPGALVIVNLAQPPQAGCGHIETTVQPTDLV